MKYSHHIEKGVFLERPNRFIAYVLLNGKQVTCHVKNTGRCKELLIPGVSVILEFHPDAEALGRKTSYSLIGVYKTVEGRQTLINMDSQAPNQVAFEWLSAQSGVSNVRREIRFGDSRFDLAFEREGKRGFMEVKGVTLEEEGIARFPDAPTERGVKHVRELETAFSEGYLSYVLLVIQMEGIRQFQPNERTHPAFGEALRSAANLGVGVLAYDCAVTENSLDIRKPIPVNLQGHREIPKITIF